MIEIQTAKEAMLIMFIAGVLIGLATAVVVAYIRELV